VPVGRAVSIFLYFRDSRNSTLSGTSPAEAARFDGAVESLAWATFQDRPLAHAEIFSTADFR
jgi:hypothetical protein